jgi:hypothetical protein
MERSTLPVTVELCARDRDGFPCLGVIHRLAPNDRVYCTRCGGTRPGVLYRRAADAEEGLAAGARP